MDATQTYLVGTTLAVLAGIVYSEWRIRRFRAHFASDAAQWLKDAFLVEEEVDVPGKGPTRVLRPSATSTAFLQAFAPAFVETAFASLKVKLPKFAPVNPATGALDFTAGIAAKMAEGKNVKPEEIAKSLFMQFGMPLIEQRLVPMVQGLTQGIGTKPKEVLPRELTLE